MSKPLALSARERIREARAAARRGDHEQALQGFLWFHRHALSEDDALYGVRLSYALSDWHELGQCFPPALQALEEVLAESVRTLRLGEGGRALFHDIVSINENLAASGQTYELYVHLREKFPELAEACADLAMPAILDAKDFALALQLMPDPRASARSIALALNRDIAGIKTRPFSRAPMRWAKIRNSTAYLLRILTALDGNGMHAESEAVKKLAIGLLQSPSVRRAFAAELVRPSNAPVHRSFRRRRH